jgi:hypothetical protein
MSKLNNDNWLDIIKRLNEMSNLTPEQERHELMEAARQEPRILDDKDVSLADIAKLAGIKEYTETTQVSKKAEKLIESIANDQSIITKAIAESDKTEKTISEKIIKSVNEDSKRLDKIAELETQLAKLKSEQKEEQTFDSKAFREVLSKDISEYIKTAQDKDLVELYNNISENEVVYNEDSEDFLIKTAETKEIIADAEKAIADEEMVQEKEKEDNEFTDKQIKMAFGVLNDPKYKGGNYDGAVEVINKIAPGLADHPSVANALKRANEDTIEAGDHEEQTQYTDDLSESQSEPITEEEFEKLAEKKDACYHKVKSRYKVWPSAYASGALVQCRKVGAANWGNKSQK